MQSVSPRQLDVFVAVATMGSVRSAAERLFLSQPAASMALGELERQIGAPLFDRERGRLRLNDRGRDLLPLARELIERHAEFGRRARGGTAGLTGEIGVGASNTIGNYLVGDLLGPFATAWPGVSLRLGVANTSRIAQGVLDHDFDVGCVEGPVTHPALEVRPWRDDRLVVCARLGHPLAARKRLRREDFADERWVLRERGSATRSLSERALAELPEGRTVLELDQSEAIKQAVIAGLGIACLPEVAVTDAVQTGRLAVLPTPFLDLRRTLSLLVHRQRYRGAVLEAFLATVASR
ncbi:LysR substrate-binding domain-containing protein [Luteibacter sahnii]|uniref:LysR substrate-binding domain-containing protein n=1 Tax=Luteibacter sahnii TaxID=3021977 RepID=UPI002A6A8EEC|nr:LysR substrate-binding domain-containing protein [Luteibacter sp. PPL193]MDY1546981.1 LysR substrate-binding domain-containing protein [Luteibacter sp. PPL193]